MKEAAAAINTSVLPVEAEGKCDPFDNVKYDPVKWQKYANSLRMRLAMRLSNIDKATAQAEFEDAAKGNKILTADDMFAVKEMMDGMSFPEYIPVHLTIRFFLQQLPIF